MKAIISVVEIIFCVFLAKNNFVHTRIPFIRVRKSRRKPEMTKTAPSLFFATDIGRRTDSLIRAPRLLRRTSQRIAQNYNPAGIYSDPFYPE